MMKELLSNIEKYHVILGSQSPRRKELLKGLGIDFEIKKIDTPEDFPSELSSVDIPMFLAEKKAKAFENQIDSNTLLITADTIVWSQGKVLGKPIDRNDAYLMLKSLSGKTHQVITGVCISTLERKETFHVVSDVQFATLTDSEINYYVEEFEPYDKAGSYGIQEWIGFIGVENINGSYYNVMGLPIQRLYNELKKWK